MGTIFEGVEAASHFNLFKSKLICLDKTEFELGPIRGVGADHVKLLVFVHVVPSPQNRELVKFASIPIYVRLMLPDDAGEWTEVDSWEAFPQRTLELVLRIADGPRDLLGGVRAGRGASRDKIPCQMIEGTPRIVQAVSNDQGPVDGEGNRLSNPESEPTDVEVHIFCDGEQWWSVNKVKSDASIKFLKVTTCPLKLKAVAGGTHSLPLEDDAKEQRGSPDTGDQAGRGDPDPDAGRSLS